MRNQFRLSQASSFVILAIALHCTAALQPLPTSDLASQSQEARDAAAAVLRTNSFVPPVAEWERLLEVLTNDSPKATVLDRLRPFNVQPEGGGGSAGTEGLLYRLDDLWLLECSFTRTPTNSILSGRKLIQRWRIIQVDPPPRFSGIWRVYYANGFKGGEGNFRDGRPEGESFGFYPDGSKSLVNHSRNGVLDGEEIAFYTSGRIKHKGQYIAGAQAGTWVWYNEDGSIQSKHNYSTP